MHDENDSRFGMTEVEIEMIDGSYVCVEVEGDWDLETLDAVEVSCGKRYETKLRGSEAQDFVDKHADLIWAELEDKADTASRIDWEDKCVRRAESGYAQ